MFRFSFIPREKKFFDLFEQSAHNVVKGAQVLKELVDNWERDKERVTEIAELEHIGDTLTHKIMAELNSTFVTPFDRDDIARLAQSLDDIMDFLNATASAMSIYKIEHSTPTAKELADIIVLAAVEVERAISYLEHRTGLKNVLPRCVEINRLENMADEVFRSAMAELFDDAEDLAQVIKWREIYEHLESATDRCEDVSNVLEGVALKYA